MRWMLLRMGFVLLGMCVGYSIRYVSVCRREMESFVMYSVEWSCAGS